MDFFNKGESFRPITVLVCVRTTEPTNEVSIDEIEAEKSASHTEDSNRIDLLAFDGWRARVTKLVNRTNTSATAQVGIGRDHRVD